MLPLGSIAERLTLPRTNHGTPLALSDILGARGTLVMFICTHCPYVVHVIPAVRRLAGVYSGGGVGWGAISSKDIENIPPTPRPR